MAFKTGASGAIQREICDRRVVRNGVAQLQLAVQNEISRALSPLMGGKRPVRLP
jgi:hypothetical protein